MRAGQDDQVVETVTDEVLQAVVYQGLVGQGEQTSGLFKGDGFEAGVETVSYYYCLSWDIVVCRHSHDYLDSVVFLLILTENLKQLK